MVVISQVRRTSKIQGERIQFQEEPNRKKEVRSERQTYTSGPNVVGL